MSFIKSTELCNGVGRYTEHEIYREDYKNHFKELSLRYHLTLTFKFGVNEKIAVKLLNDLLLYINRAILKQRYNKHGEAIQGYVVKEATPSMDNIHFHIVFSDPEKKLPDFDKMERVIKKKIVNVNRTVSKLNQINKNLLQDYYEGDDNSSLEQYITKIFERTDLSLKEKMDSISPIG